MQLALLGDVMLGRLVNDALRARPAEYVWGDTLDLIRSADWRACNLECVISDRGRPWAAYPKAFHFRSDARNVAVLRAAGIDAVALANNHTLDFDYDAMFDMLEILDAHGIAHAGAGADLASASAPAVCDAPPGRIGLIAFTDNEPPWEATASQPGVFHVPIDLSDARAIHLLEIVRRAKRTLDVLIVSAHWGPNWGYHPPPEHPPFARALLDAGADVIFGHSPHVFRGIQMHDAQPVLYSAGDFVDDYAVDELERNDESFIFALELEGQRIDRLRLYPVVIADFQVRRADPRQAEHIARKMQRLCVELAAPARWNPSAGCLELATA